MWRWKEREGERREERGVVKKVLMTHLKTVSAGNDTSTNIREKQKNQGTRANPPLSTSCKTKEASLIKMATNN